MLSVSGEGGEGREGEAHNSFYTLFFPSAVLYRLSGVDGGGNFYGWLPINLILLFDIFCIQSCINN
jgi:hypothetical protein